MSHTLLSPSPLLCITVLSFLYLTPSIHPFLPHPSPSVFLFSYIYISMHLSASLPSPISPSPSFFMWFNNWCETFCLPSDVWGGLRDMTRLWRALCTTPDTHTHKNAHMDTHRHTHLLQSSSKGHFCCINVAEEKVLGVCACQAFIQIPISSHQIG